MKDALLGALAALALVYVVGWIWLETRRRRAAAAHGVRPGLRELATGFLTDFLDTLGIGNFAPTTAVLKLFRLVPDERIPGTLNAGHALPVVTEALIYIAIIEVDLPTLGTMILGLVAGRVIRSDRTPRQRSDRLDLHAASVGAVTPSSVPTVVTASPRAKSASRVAWS